MQGNNFRKEELARHYLIAYCKLMFPDYKVSNHLALIADALERVERGECKRLMISMPPRHGKSQMASEFFPAWYLGRNPDKYIITATYSQDLANDFGRKVRNQMLDEYHQATFPDCRIVDDSKAKNKFSTTAKGVYYAVGVGSSMTGRGAHLCLPAGTKVSTYYGYTDIALLSPGDVVLSYNEASGNAEEQVVEAVSNRIASSLHKITTTSGRVVEATGEHPFLTTRGYISADTIASGDTLLCCVRRSVYQTSLRGRKKHPKRTQRPLLLEAMFRGTPRNKKREAMSGLRESNKKGLNKKRKILQRLQGQAQISKTGDIQKNQKKMPGLQHGIYGYGIQIHQSRNSAALQQKMLRNRAFKTNVKHREPEVETRGNTTPSTTPLCQSLPGDAATCPKKRPTQMRRVRVRKTSSCAPYRQLAHEQHGKQPRDIMRPLPQKMACSDRFKTIQDTVALVERVHKQTHVYDIQVSGNHNFFANEICVHNCLIDDPLKGRKEAESEVMRQGLKDWYTSVAYTRLMPGGAIIIIQTRWHEDDLAGWVAREHSHENWEILNLPAINDQNEPLWPEQYPLETLQNIKRTIGSRDWEALYQQRPAASEGEIFKREWWQWYKEAPKLKWIMQSWDTAFKKGAENDYSVCTTWGVSDKGYYLLDRWKNKVEFPELKRTVVNLANKWNPRAILIEDKASGQSLIQELKTNTNLNILPINVDSDKITRAYAVTPMIEAGNVYLPEDSEWVQDFVDECAVFPNGVNDDSVDSLTQALNHFRRKGEAAFKDFAEAAETSKKGQHVWIPKDGTNVYTCDQCGIALRVPDGKTPQQVAEENGMGTCTPTP